MKTKWLQISCKFFNTGEPDISIFHPEEEDGSYLVEVLDETKEAIGKRKRLGEILLSFENNKKGKTAINKSIQKIQSILMENKMYKRIC